MCMTFRQCVSVTLKGKRLCFLSFIDGFNYYLNILVKVIHYDTMFGVQKT